MIPPLAMTEADGFAIAMIVMLALSLGTVALILVAILRHKGKADSEADDFTDDGAPEKKAAAGTPAAEKEPWEKDADWWRNPD